MKILIAIALFSVVSSISFFSFAQGTPPVVPQPITTLSNPDGDIEKEPSKYGKFRLEKTEKDEKMIFFDRIIPEKKTHELFKIDTGGEYTGAVEQLGVVELPFISPNGEEFHIFQVVYAGSGGVSTNLNAIVIEKEKIWASPDIHLALVYHPQKDEYIGIEQAYIIQQQGKTVLSLVVPPTTNSNGETYNISMESLETKQVDALPRWAKSTRTFKIVGKFQAETDNASGWRPLMLGQETPMDAKAPTDDQEYLIDHIGTCSLATSGDEAYEGIPAEMTLLETAWSDGAIEYSCLYLKSL